MSSAINRQQVARRKLELVQLSLLLTVVVGFWLLMDWKAGISTLYGGVVVFANSRLQRWQLQRAAHAAGNSPAKNLRYLYRCAAERFVTTVSLFAVGFGLMAMPPLPLLSGYIIAQVAVIYGFYQESSLRRRHG